MLDYRASARLGQPEEKVPLKDIDKCPKCGGELEYDEVDVGVGVIKANPGCPACHWTLDRRYDMLETPSVSETKKCP